MKTVVYKYPIRLGIFTHEMPEGAEFLSVQVQRGEPQMWWRVDPFAPKQRRDFRVFGPGHEIDDSAPSGRFRYLGTFQLDDGLFIGHLFQEEWS